MYNQLLTVDQWRKNQKNWYRRVMLSDTHVFSESDSNGQMRINMGDNSIKGCETIVIFVQKKVCSKKIIYF